MMQLIGIPGKLSTATLVSNYFFTNIDAGEDHDKTFDYANINFGQFCELVKEMSHLCNPVIATYTPSIFNLVQRKVNGYTAGDYNTIWLNSRRLENRYLEDIVGTICHEYVHCLEHHIKKIRPKIYFNHGTTNTPKGDTLPEFIAEISRDSTHHFLESWIAYNTECKSDRSIGAELKLGKLGYE